MYIINFFFLFFNGILRNYVVKWMWFYFIFNNKRNFNKIRCIVYK